MGCSKQYCGLPFGKAQDRTERTLRQAQGMLLIAPRPQTSNASVDVFALEKIIIQQSIQSRREA